MVEMRVIVVVMNVEISVEMVMLKKLDFAAILPNPLHPPNNTPNNQSKPIVPIPSFSLSFPLITSRYTIIISSSSIITSSYTLYTSITSSYITISFSHSIIIIISLTFVITISHTIVIKTSSNNTIKSNKTFSHNDQQH